MSDPETTTHDQWRAARLDLLAKEKELTRHRDEVNAARRRLPMVEITKDYSLHGPHGQARLVDLFEGRDQLLIYHFMFGPDDDEGCPSCSFTIDNVGHLSHLYARNTSFAVVSRAPLEKLERYRKRLGWTVPWYSSQGSDFNYDFHVVSRPVSRTGRIQLQGRGRTRADGSCLARMVWRGARRKRISAPR